MERIGRWWERGEEIDVIGLNTQTKEIIFGEAKYSQKKAGGKVYNDLVDKAKYVDWNNEQRKEYFILFSKSGFEESLIRLAGKKQVFLVKENCLIL